MNAILLSPLGAWPAPGALLQAARDTVVMVPARSPFAVAESIALVVIALAAVALFVLFLRVVLEARRMERKLTRILDRMEERLDPVMERTANVAENVDFVSRVVREDAERVSESVRGMGERLDQASDRMEERIREFNALMELIQSEAEDLFIDTASTVRGVREGTRTIRDGRRPPGDREAVPDHVPPPPERKPVEEGGLPDVDADLPVSED